MTSCIGVDDVFVLPILPTQLQKCTLERTFVGVRSLGHEFVHHQNSIFISPLDQTLLTTSEVQILLVMLNLHDRLRVGLRRQHQYTLTTRLNTAENPVVSRLHRQFARYAYTGHWNVTQVALWSTCTCIALLCSRPMYMRHAWSGALARLWPTLSSNIGSDISPAAKLEKSMYLKVGYNF